MQRTASLPPLRNAIFGGCASAPAGGFAPAAPFEAGGSGQLPSSAAAPARQLPRRSAVGGGVYVCVSREPAQEWAGRGGAGRSSRSLTARRGVTLRRGAGSGRAAAAAERRRTERCGTERRGAARRGEESCGARPSPAPGAGQRPRQRRGAGATQGPGAACAAAAGRGGGGRREGLTRLKY